MHGIQNGFSRGFNRRHRRTGSLWQSRYQARHVGEQGYLDRLVLYVHLNPVEAGVVKEPADYVFAGHREVKKRIRDPLVDVDAMLLCFGTTEKAARRSYLAAIRAAKDADAEGLSKDWHPFANDPEIKMDPKADHVDALGRTTGLERPRLEAEQFVGMVCEIGGIDQERLASRARDRETAEARRLIATLGAERWGQSRRDLARVMNKNPDVVSWWVGEGSQRRVDDQSFAGRLDGLDNKLAASLAGVKGGRKNS